MAVIDSGILPSHPDLINQQASTGYDFISSADYSGDNDGLDSDPNTASLRVDWLLNQWDIKNKG